MSDKKVEVEEKAEAATIVGEEIFNVLVKVTRKVTGSVTLDVDAEVSDPKNELAKKGEDVSSLSLEDVYRKMGARYHIKRERERGGE